MEAISPLRIVVLDPLLSDVGKAEAPVAVRDVARDEQVLEFENVPAGGLDFGRPVLHVVVTAAAWRAALKTDAARTPAALEA